MQLKKKDLIIVLCAGLLSMSSAQAMEYGAGLSVKHWQWQEHSNGRRLLNETGPIYTLKLSVATDAPADDALLQQTRLNLDLFNNGVDYDGATQAGTPVKTTTRYRGWDLSVEQPFRVKATEQYHVDLLARLGHREWDRNIKSTPVAIGTEEDWAYSYVGAGLQIEQATAHPWFGKIVIDRPFGMKEKLRLAKFGFDSDPTLHPKVNWHWRVEAGKRLGDHDQWEVSVFALERKFGRSNTVNAVFNGTPVPVFQPDSKERSYGIQAKYYF